MLVDPKPDIFRPTVVAFPSPVSCSSPLGFLPPGAALIVPCEPMMHSRNGIHGRMARGGHGLPKSSPGLVMPNPSTPCGRATPETASWPLQGWPTHRVGSLRTSFALLDTSRRAPMNSMAAKTEPRFVFFGRFSA
jgi:hypothetical protein